MHIAAHRVDSEEDLGAVALDGRLLYRVGELPILDEEAVQDPERKVAGGLHNLAATDVLGIQPKLGVGDDLLGIEVAGPYASVAHPRQRDIQEALAAPVRRTPDAK